MSSDEAPQKSLEPSLVEKTNHPSFITKTIIGFVSLLLVGLVLGFVAGKYGTKIEKQTVTIRGNASMDFQANKGMLTGDIIPFSPTEAGALQEAAITLVQVKAALKGLGVGDVHYDDPIVFTPDGNISGSGGGGSSGGEGGSALGIQTPEVSPTPADTSGCIDCPPKQSEYSVASAFQIDLNQTNVDKSYKIMATLSKLNSNPTVSYERNDPEGDALLVKNKALEDVNRQINSILYTKKAHLIKVISIKDISEPSMVGMSFTYYDNEADDRAARKITTTASYEATYEIEFPTSWFSFK